MSKSKRAESAPRQQMPSGPQQPGRQTSPPEQKIKGLAKLKYILFLAKPYWKYGKLYTLVTLFTSAILSPLSSVAGTMLPKAAIDSVMQHKETADILITIGTYTIVILLVNVVQLVISQAYSTKTQVRIQYNLFYEVNERALRTDFKYYDDPEFFTQFSYAQQNYPNQAQQVITIIPTLLNSLITAAAMGTIITMAGPVLLLVTLGFVILQTLIQLPVVKRNADYSVKITDWSRRTNYVYRSLQMKENTAEMRTSSAGEKLLRAFRNTVDEITHIYGKLVRSTMPFTVARGVISPLQTSIILVYIILFVIAGDTTKIGLYASLTAAAATLSGQLTNLFNNISSVFSSIVYGERIAKFFETVSVIEPPIKGAAPPPDGRYAVELRDVTFAYRNADFGIRQMNLAVAPGQRIAIVGENGAGKSTLTKLLLRLYDVDSGQVLINGRDIRDYDVHALRRHIGIAYQDVHVLAMSLRDNLTAYNDATDEELLEVIGTLGLQSVLEKGGGSLDMQVSREFTEDGIVLSGGEAQRVALARLFTGPFGLLLLDEPSSALDPLAEFNLMQVILDKSNTATTIMIAHRLSTVRDFDVIYHMENGEIIETGTHSELMAARGKYYEMFTKQAENYVT
jgi:ATP-binding cassette subfamily B protein